MTGIKSTADQARALQHLLDEDAVMNTTWTSSDMRAMLEHQLSVPLSVDLVPVVEDADAQLSTLSGRVKTPPENFGEALTAPSPSLEHLRLIKEFAKQLQLASGPELPRDLLNVIYYAAIVAALVRCEARITKLGDAALRKGCAWCLNRPWLTPALRTLFEEGTARLPGHD